MKNAQSETIPQQSEVLFCKRMIFSGKTGKQKIKANLKDRSYERHKNGKQYQNDIIALLMISKCRINLPGIKEEYPALSDVINTVYLVLKLALAKVFALIRLHPKLCRC